MGTAELIDTVFLAVLDGRKYLCDLLGREAALLDSDAHELVEADELTEEDTHCHGLRATAASHHAGRGMPTLALQALMGWAQPATARSYVRSSPENTQRELHQIHSQ